METGTIRYSHMWPEVFYLFCDSALAFFSVMSGHPGGKLLTEEFMN